MSINLLGAGTSALSFCTEANALFAAMVVKPDTVHKIYINGLIVELKNKGIWSLLDMLQVYAGHNQTAMNWDWLNPGNSGRAAGTVGSPTWTAYQGYTGDILANSNYINTQFTPSTMASNFTANSGCHGGYVRLPGGTTTNHDDVPFGVANFVPTNNYNNVQITYNGSGTTFGLCSYQGGSSTSFADSTGVGFYAVQRIGTAHSLYYRGSSVSSVTSTAATYLNAAPDFVLGYNAASFFSGGFTGQVGLRFWSAALTAQQHLDFYNAVQAYFTNLGTAV